MASGPLIDAIATAMRGSIPEHARRCRQLRDGPTYHITLSPKAEFSQRESNPLEEHDLDDLALTPLIPLGVATAKSSQFVVVLWPAAQAYRERLGFPPVDLHITLGFDKQDAHGVSKGALQLAVAELQPPLPCGWRIWPDVVAVAQAAADKVRRQPAEADAAVAALSQLCGEARDANEPAAEGALLSIRGGLYGSLGRLGEAVDDAEAACARAPPLPQPWLLLASCHMAGGRVADAAEAAATAARLLGADEHFEVAHDEAAAVKECLARLKSLGRETRDEKPA